MECVNKRKILCLIDSLGAGGAERQMIGLASMLHNSGYKLKLCYFESKHFFVDDLKNNGIDVVYYEKKNYIDLLSKFYKEFRIYKPDVVISYLQSSSIIASIIRVFSFKHQFRLIVSERNTNTSKGLRDIIRFNLFRWADYVIPNSFSQQEFISKHFSFLSPRVKTIINFVNTERFNFIERKKGCDIIVAATIWPSKNTLGLISALKILKGKGVKFHVKWFGIVKGQEEYIEKCRSLINSYSLDNDIELLPKTQNINQEYAKANYFCLPSFYEGTPNVICEAMSTGLPIICSNVCDNGKYVERDKNGFLFNPNDPSSIAEGIEMALSISEEEYRIMSLVNRKKAEILFDKQTFLQSYINIINN